MRFVTLGSTFLFLGGEVLFWQQRVFIAALTIGLWLEAVPALRAGWTAQWGALALLAVLSLGLLLWGNSARLMVQIAPEQDVQALGLLASFWRYWQQGRERPSLSSPFENAAPTSASVLSGADSLGNLPHLVSVQSESFFDARRISDGIRPEILAEFDRFRAEAVASGYLQVPAWGANTVRSEFSFLSGIEKQHFGRAPLQPLSCSMCGMVCGDFGFLVEAAGLPHDLYPPLSRQFLPAQPCISAVWV